MEPVGLIGFGEIGSMAGCKILAAGYPLYVYDGAKSTIEKAVVMGASPTISIAELAAICSILLILLPEPTQVIDCIRGEEGLLHSILPGAVIVDPSTIDPGTTEAMVVRAEKKKVG